MKILLDTHCWLWWTTAPEKLREPALAQIADAENTILLSAASSWEIAIKYALGKLPLPEAPEIFVPKRMARDAVHALPIEHAHALRVASLPLHHADPFDRLLVAQAQVEGIPLMTVDRQFEAYNVEIIWAD
jgi:PIN domain nuclease of toxin-antitoxin system